MRRSYHFQLFAAVAFISLLVSCSKDLKETQPVQNGSVDLSGTSAEDQI